MADTTQLRELVDVLEARITNEKRNQQTLYDAGYLAGIKACHELVKKTFRKELL